jgi:glutathione S-transferase
MYKIVGSPQSRLTRVSWMLEELGQAYEIEKASPHSAELKQYNPGGKGPVLVDTHSSEQVVIIDSAAICSYLADRHPEANMSAKPGTKDRAAIESWLHFAQCDLEAPLWLKAKHKFILPEDMRLDVSAVTKYELNNAVAAMDARLGDNEFAIGNRFTSADVLLGHAGNWARNAKFEISSARVNAYLDRVLARPAIAAAREKEAQLSGGGNL